MVYPKIVYVQNFQDYYFKLMVFLVKLTVFEDQELFKVLEINRRANLRFIFSTFRALFIFLLFFLVTESFNTNLKTISSAR